MLVVALERLGLGRIADTLPERPVRSEDCVQACQRALQTADCTALAQGTLPAECQQVVY